MSILQISRGVTSSFLDVYKRQVQHGRKPSDKEVAEAAKTGFALSSGLSRQKNSKFRQVLSKVGLGDLKFSWFLVLEILLLICIALFGYVVGYLFI